MPGPITDWLDNSTVDKCSDNDQESPVQQVGKRVEHTWRKRDSTSRYQHVVVLLIHWKEHDLGDSIDKSASKYEWMFEYLYNYEVWRVKLPGKKPHESLARDLLQLARKDSPDVLFIIWYDGHGVEHGDRRGSPTWCSHRDPKLVIYPSYIMQLPPPSPISMLAVCRKSQTLDSTIISTILSDCEADILLVNNSCNSLTCSRFNGTGVVEAISASAFQTLTYGAIDASDPSPSLSWAAHKILSDKNCVDEGITVAELHRRICVATQWGVTYNDPNLNGPDASEGQFELKPFSFFAIIP